tara:strand:- start:184 stop:312 length:129 start_codon:yes stop_codon:yes gene_type:complete
MIFKKSIYLTLLKVKWWDWKIQKLINKASDLSKSDFNKLKYV